MSRDHRKLRVFTLADELALRSTESTATSAVSIATNIVEGCARRSAAEYRNFLNVATGSSAEAGYLVNVAGRLNLLDPAHAERLGVGYGELTAALKKLVEVLEERGD